MANDKAVKPKSPPRVPGKASVEEPAQAVEVGQSKSAPAKQLELPRGAMLVMRVSGGIRFTTQEMAVYPDGRVTLGAGDVSKRVYERAARALNDAQVVRLRRLLEQSGFFRMSQPEGKQSPDSYAYEILARLGGRSNRIEVFTGTMPGGIQSLVDFLMRWMPQDQAEAEQGS